MPKSKKESSAQSGQISYALHSLGWKAFQSLCVSITAELWGQTVTSFADTSDGGRDGAFHGVWSPNDAESFSGNFTVQAKFTAKATKSLTLSGLDDELKKARALASKGLATTYVLMTNAVLSGTAEEKIRDEFEAIDGIDHFAAYGPDRISQMIHENSRLRMLVPRIYGLGDLSQILDKRAYDQSQDILSALGDDLSKFVITDPFRASAKALISHGFVLLLGEPACGKSTIAAALALGALDEWGCSTIKVVSPSEFIAHSNPHEPRQFFWVDDAFGATQLDWSATVEWNKIFPHIYAAIKRGARVVFTSRDYIYKSARQHLKETAFPLLRESQVVINVENLTKGEREQILYNHIRLGGQSVEFKSTVKRFLSGAAEHERFSPESARRLGTPFFTKDISLSKFGIDDFFERPMDLLKETIRTLDPSSRSAIALVFIRGGMLPSPVDITSAEQNAIDLLGGKKAEVRNALVSLQGSLVSLVKKGEGRSWGFKHPTIRDAFATLVSDDPELLDIYIAGTPIMTLLNEVSCGTVDMEGLKVMIPLSRYDRFSEKLETFFKKRRENEGKVHRFLAYRCSKDYLKYFLDRNGSFIDSLRPSAYLYWVSDVDLLVRLHKFGLLPEKKRVAVIERIRELAVDVPDAGFLADDVRTLFEPHELTSILSIVKHDLIPNLDHHVESWQTECPGDEDPDSFFEPLISALNDYKEEYSSDAVVVQSIEKAVAKIETIVEHLQSELPDEFVYDDFSKSDEPDQLDDVQRSIFDDVDQ